MNNEIKEIRQVKDTPFTIVNDGIWHICIGNNIIVTEQFEKPEEAIKYINKKPYEIIINLIGLMIETRLTNKTEEK